MGPYCKHVILSQVRDISFSTCSTKENCGSSHLLLDLVCNFIFSCSVQEAGLGVHDKQHLGLIAFLRLILTSHWDKALESKDFSKNKEYFFSALIVLYKLN